METSTRKSPRSSNRIALELNLSRYIDALVPRKIIESANRNRLFQARIFASFSIVMLCLELPVVIVYIADYGWDHLRTIVNLCFILILITSYAVFRLFNREVFAFIMLLFGGLGLYFTDLYNSGLIYSHALIWAPIIVWSVAYYRGKNYALLVGGCCATFVLCSWFLFQSNGSTSTQNFFASQNSTDALTEFVSAMVAAIILSYVFRMSRDKLENEVENSNQALNMASDSLESHQALLTTILDTIPHCILMKNADGEVLKVNHAMAVDFGQSAEFMEGFDAMDLASGDATEAELVRQTDKEVVAGCGEKIELTMRRSFSNGDMRYLHIIKSPLRDTKSSIIGIVEVWVDVTDRVKAEQNARILERMEAIVQTIGGVCHTYNNKNQIVLGTLHKIKTVGGVEIQKLSKRIEQAVQSTTELNNQLVTYSRKRLRPERTVMNPTLLLGEILEQRVSNLPSSMILDVRTDPNLHNICINREEFIRSVNCLLDNAQEAMGSGGRLEVRATNIKFQKSKKRPQHLMSGDHVEISISDEGCGMTRVDAKKAFEPFFTTKDPAVHAGLGLSNVYGIIKDACGHIEIKSIYGKGTVVRAILPRALDVGGSI